MTPLPYPHLVALSVTTTALGAPALDALADAVRAALAGDPLRAVTVVVPTNTTGVMARRALGRRGGFAAVDVLTMFRLAELLGAPALHAAGRKPAGEAIGNAGVTGGRLQLGAGTPKDQPGQAKNRALGPVEVGLAPA